MVTLPAAAEIVVIGGGPAGLAAAVAARRRGLDAVVLERGGAPVDKACGEGVMPDGVAALRRLGIDLRAAPHMPFRGIRFLGDGKVAEARFPEGSGLGVRRTELHRLLADAAVAAGVPVCWQARVDAVADDAVTVAGRRIRCRWVVAADGLHSPTARRLALPPMLSSPRRLGLRRHFRVTPWSDLVEVHWASGCQAYVTPVAPDEVCVALIGPAPALDLAGVAQRFPRLAHGLAGAREIGAARGGMTVTARLPAVSKGRLALIGDASGTVDAVTGEGIAVAFHQALALADALAAGDLGRYEAAHRAICRRPRLMARALLLMDRSDAVRRRALAALAAHPRIFGRLLALHVGALRPAAVSFDVIRLMGGLVAGRDRP